MLEHAAWDFVAVYYDAIDHFCHGFMRYHPPRLPWIAEEDFDDLSACRGHRLSLPRRDARPLLELAGPEARRC